MGKRRARLADQALAHLNGIADYIGRHNAAAADRVIETLIETFSSLAENPDLGEQRDDLQPGARIFSPSPPAHNYVVLYTKTDDGVEIAAVIHGARDWPKLFAGGNR
jgi:toxin ParE1/3/4